MLGKLRAGNPWLRAGIALVATGAAILVIGLPFVWGWLPWATGVPTSTVLPGSCSPGICTIYVLISEPPNPGPLLAAYAGGIAVVVGAAWWLVRRAPAAAGQRPGSRRWARVGIVLLIATVGWMALFLGIGLAHAWSSIPEASGVRVLVLALVVAFPALLVVEGASLVVTAGKRDLSGSPPAGPE